jgi:hypothetical protein
MQMPPMGLWACAERVYRVHCRSKGTLSEGDPEGDMWPVATLRLELFHGAYLLLEPLSHKCVRRV